MFIIFLLLSWLIMVFDAMHGFFPAASTRGLGMVLPEYSIGVEELLQLDNRSWVVFSDGQLVEVFSDTFAIAEVAPGGRIFVNGNQLKDSDLFPWEKAPLLVQCNTVFLRPLPGTTYGEVLVAMDLLRNRSTADNGRPSRVLLTRIESIPQGFVRPPTVQSTESAIQRQ